MPVGILRRDCAEKRMRFVDLRVRRAMSGDFNSNLDGKQIEAILRQRLGRRACEVRVLLRCDEVVLQ